MGFVVQTFFCPTPSRGAGARSSTRAPGSAHYVELGRELKRMQREEVRDVSAGDSREGQRRQPLRQRPGPVQPEVLPELLPTLPRAYIPRRPGRTRCWTAAPFPLALLPGLLLLLASGSLVTWGSRQENVPGHGGEQRTVLRPLQPTRRGAAGGRSSAGAPPSLRLSPDGPAQHPGEVEESGAAPSRGERGTLRKPWMDWLLP